MSRLLPDSGCNLRTKDPCVLLVDAITNQIGNPQESLWVLTGRGATERGPAGSTGRRAGQ